MNKKTNHFLWIAFCLLPLLCATILLAVPIVTSPLVTALTFPTGLEVAVQQYFATNKIAAIYLFLTLVSSLLLVFRLRCGGWIGLGLHLYVLIVAFGEPLPQGVIVSFFGLVWYAILLFESESIVEK